MEFNDINSFGFYIKSWYKEGKKPKYKVLSLFSGGGGLDLAFHDAGFDVVYMVEKDRNCIETLRLNAQYDGLLSGSLEVGIDVESYEAPPDSHFDFIIGGPPCQSFSAAGRRMAGVLGTTVPGGQLFEHYVRLLKKFQPRGFLFENVLGLLSAQQGGAWETMKGAFTSAGYQPFISVLDSADYGVPQHRERVIVIGVRTGSFLFPAPTHGPNSSQKIPYMTAAQALAGLINADEDNLPKQPTGKYGHLLDDIPPGLNYTFYTERLGHPRPVFSWRSKFSDFLYKAAPDEPTRTIKANGGPYSGPFHWTGRPFTLAELKRLQTFPDEYKLFGSRGIAFRQIGNAVPPQLGRILALAVRNQIFNEDIPLELKYLSYAESIRPRKIKRNVTDFHIKKIRESSATSIQVEKAVFDNQQYLRYLTNNFGWKSESSGIETAIFLINIKVTSKIGRIKVKLPERSGSSAAVYTLSIKPAAGCKWPFNLNEVQLQATDTSHSAFIACWKAFQEFTNREAHLADLIQLSGYYYFRQQLSIKLKLNSKIPPPNWLAAAEKVVAGNGVGKILNTASIANSWGIREDQVPAYLSELRALGYEVRGNNINPQIPEGEYLIPYSFPTLTEYSPHRRKSLDAVTK